MAITATCLYCERNITLTVDNQWFDLDGNYLCGEGSRIGHPHAPRAGTIHRNLQELRESEKMSKAKPVIPCSHVDAWKHMDDVQFGGIPDGERQRVVFWFPRHPRMVQYEAERVACLIKVAPEMLEALEAMVPCDECKTRGIPNTAKFNWPKCDRCIKAESAIRKARGEQC